MFAGTPQERSPVADARHASPLSEQITHLRELIVVMVDLGRDTRRQSELLFRLLGELRAARLVRAAAQADERLSLPALSKSRLDA